MGYPMDAPPKLLFGTLHYADRCGAKTRQAGRCQNMPMQIGGRCRMHGGGALRGPEHPRYKHGKYSKYPPPMELDDLIAYWATQPDPLADFPQVDLGALFADMVLPDLGDR